MKVTKLLKNESWSGFFFDFKNLDFGVCVKFVSLAHGENLSDCSINASLSTSNRKKKGWKKVIRSGPSDAILKGKRFDVCLVEQKFLNRCGVQVGQSFWIKIELA